ncbi:MAG TPA: hypothetical protein VNI52_03015 [Sphingobacteriaceae bacterium]|nr:hypothetical protein [Sphingobacteriaceae bacterium]
MGIGFREMPYIGLPRSSPERMSASYRVGSPMYKRAKRILYIVLRVKGVPELIALPLSYSTKVVKKQNRSNSTSAGIT